MDRPPTTFEVARTLTNSQSNRNSSYQRLSYVLRDLNSVCKNFFYRYPHLADTVLKHLRQDIEDLRSFVPPTENIKTPF